jgi:hypothetical protein
MWVRSQDGRILHKCGNVELTPDGKGVHAELGPVISFLGFILPKFFRPYAYKRLGEYNSKAEALKVLDMIQGQHDMDVYEHGPEGMRLFQMPPKGFSTAGGE